MDDRSPTIRLFGTSASSPPIVRRSASRVLFHAPALPDDLVAALWNRPDELMDAGGAIQQGKRKHLVRVVWGSQSYVMKHYGRSSLRHVIKHTLAHTQARRAYQVGCALADAGVLTPRPVACVENRRWRIEGDSYLLYPHVEGLSLKAAISQGYMNDADIEAAIKQLEELWKRLAALRFGLRDAAAKNFIVTPGGQLWLIDLDDTCFHRSVHIARIRLKRRWEQVSRTIRWAVEARNPAAEPLKSSA